MCCVVCDVWCIVVGGCCCGVCVGVGSLCGSAVVVVCGLEF